MDNLKPARVIGIVGGVASGKSAVTDLFKQLGARIVSADEIAHRVLCEPDIVESILQTFGHEVLQTSHPSHLDTRVIDRKKLGRLVFGPGAESRRKQLESIVHPRIRQIAKQELESYQHQPDCAMVVLDAPLLIEGGWLPFCQKLIFIDTPEAMRKSFAMQRGWTEQEWQQREAAQLSLNEKRQHASDILQNEGNLEQLKSKLVQLISAW
jgi:dephospho-CoA kinase